MFLRFHLCCNKLNTTKTPWFHVLYQPTRITYILNVFFGHRCGNGYSYGGCGGHYVGCGGSRSSTEGCYGCSYDG